MLREIDQDIHAVATDGFRERLVGNPEDIVPPVGVLTKFLGKVIQTHDARITNNLELLPIVKAKEREQIPADDMAP